MPLHRDPGALGGDAHALVVVAGRAAGGEGIAEPEAVVGGDAVGDVGEGRGALVRGDHQVGVVLVVAHHLGRRHHRAFLEVVGDVQQAGNEDAVAGDGLGLDLVTSAAQGQAPWNEAALGADRHDHRVLHLLGLDQAEHLGAVVLLAIRPAQAATRDLAAAQVHALDARRIDEDLVLGHRLGHLRNGPRVQFEAEVILGLAIGIGLVVVGAQRGLDQVQVATQDAVFVEHRDPVQGRDYGLLEALLLVFQVLGAELARQVETGLEQAHQFAGDVHMVDQGAGDIAEIEAQANLLEVTGIGPQQRHVAPAHAGGQHQTVERIVLRRALTDAHEGFLQVVVELLDIDVQVLGVGEGKVVNPVLTAVPVAHVEGELAQHAQPEVFQNRQHVRQRQRRVGMVELAVQLPVPLGQWPVEAHHQRTLLAQLEQVLHVHHRRMRRETLAVASRETTGEGGQHVGALGFAEILDDQADVVVLP